MRKVEGKRERERLIRGGGNKSMKKQEDPLARSRCSLNVSMRTSRARGGSRITNARGNTLRPSSDIA